MAKCTVIQKTVEKLVKVNEPEVHLILTSEEAEVVHALTGFVVGGGPIRDLTDAVYHALDNQNIESRKLFKGYSVEIRDELRK